MWQEYLNRGEAETCRASKLPSVSVESILVFFVGRGGVFVAAFPLLWACALLVPPRGKAADFWGEDHGFPLLLLSSTRHIKAEDKQHNEPTIVLRGFGIMGWDLWRGPGTLCHTSAEL